MRVSSPVVHSGSDTATRIQSSGYDLYDYGVDYISPARKLTPGEADASKAEAAKRHAAADLATFKFHHERALAGDEFSQRRLAQLYLTGTGCEKDTNAARLAGRRRHQLPDKVKNRKAETRNFKPGPGHAFLCRWFSPFCFPFSAFLFQTHHAPNARPVPA